MVADGLGFELDDISETIEPVIAAEPVKTEFLEVAPGQVAGVHQIARGTDGGEEKIYMELKMYVGAEDPADSIELKGEPNLALTIPGGTHGDIATAAVVVNAIPSILAAQSGLRTARDLAVQLFSRPFPRRSCKSGFIPEARNRRIVRVVLRRIFHGAIRRERGCSSRQVEPFFLRQVRGRDEYPCASAAEEN